MFNVGTIPALSMHPIDTKIYMSHLRDNISKLFLQLHQWYKLLDALDLVNNLLQVHSNHINNDSQVEHSFPAPLVYLLSHTLINQGKVMR